MDNQVETLQPSLLFSILSTGWGAGLNREGGLTQNLTAKGGLISYYWGGPKREMGWGGGLIELSW